MSGDEKFWVVVWGFVATVVCSLIVTIGGVTAYKASVLQSMVEGGADPMRAACGLDVGERKEGVCSIIAAHPI